MSCYLVSDTHLSYLASAAILFQVQPVLTPGQPAVMTGDEIVELLEFENLLSVGYRYTGQVAFPVLMAPTWTFTNVEPVQLLKAIECYEYQACEHPEWDGSKAAALCKALKATAITKLPGYSGAKWGL